MPLNMFWHGEMELLQAYQKAYYSNASYTAWMQGYYNFVAHSISLGNAFAKKGAKPVEYPKYKDPMDKLNAPIEKPRDVEDAFREQQCAFSDWLNKK